MRKLILLVVCLLALHVVSAKLIVTEVMYHPNPEQGGNYNEWVELYNDGPAFELAGYFINGKSISSVNVSSKAILVVAEKAAGNGSLDSVYGNGDGVWDSSDPFLAVDASSFSLDDSSGFVNVSNGVEEIVINYISSWGADGNGKTLERTSLTSEEFVESAQVGGSPGSFSENTSESDGNVNLDASINNVGPSIASIIIGPDDGAEPGVQVYPDYNSDKVVNVSVEVVDDNGVDDLSSVVLEVSDKEAELVSIEDLSDVSVRYSWNIRMSVNDREGFYSLNVTATDSQGSSSFNASQFEYSGLLSIRVSKSSLTFGSLDPGSSSVSNITIRNNGNSAVDVEISGTNLTNGDKSIPISSVECLFEENWFALGYSPETLDMDLAGSSAADLSLKFNAPLGFKSDKYSGTITIAAVRG
ncbi:MAG: hypothetical protein ABIH63_01525 [archaeon]